MTDFVTSARSHFANGDLEALERLLDGAAQSRVENRPDIPRTSEFLVAERLLDQLKIAEAHDGRERLLG